MSEELAGGFALITVAVAGGRLSAGRHQVFALLLTGVWALAAGVSLTLTNRRYWACIASACLALQFVDQTPFHPFGIDIRIYQILSLLLLGIPFAHLEAPDGLGRLLLFSTALVNVSLVWSVSPKDTVVVGLGQIYLYFLYLATRNVLVRGVISVARALEVLRISAMLSGLLALLQFGMAFAGLRWNVFHLSGVPWPRPAGLMTEPDWSGLVSALGLVLAIYAPSTARFRRTSLVVSSLVVILAAARAVWVGLAAVAIVLVLQKRPEFRRVGLRAISLGLVLILTVGMYSLYDPAVLARVTPSMVLSGAGDHGAANSRLAVMNFILAQGDPLLGRGAGTLAFETARQHVQQAYAGGGQLNAGHGSANLFATSYWDLGLLGLSLFLLIAIWWLRRAASVSEGNPALLPLAVLVLADFQFNNGLRFGFVWILMSLTAAAWEIQGRRQRQTVVAGDLEARQARVGPAWV